MAEEKKVKKDHGKWFREMRSELMKVVWPSAKDHRQEYRHGAAVLCGSGRLHLDLRRRGDAAD